jgi:hypothetical protein
MNRVPSGLLLAALAGCRTVAPSLTDPPGTVYAHFLDQNYLFFPTKPPRLKYEAQLSTHITLGQNLREANIKLTRDTLSDRIIAGSLVATPAFVIRQLDDSSAAVRTPSFNPKGTFQYFWLHKVLKDGAFTSRQKRDPKNWKHIDGWMIDAVFAHYSNGQAGCFFQRQTMVRVGSDFECRWLGVVDSAINESDGSFSTWYLRGGGGFERMWVNPNNASLARRVGTMFTLQYHIPAMTEDPQEKLYGDIRARGIVELESHSLRDKLEGAWRFAAIGERAFRTGPNVPSHQWSVELARSFTRLYGLGAFARLRGGQDYYNIAFKNTLNLLQWGFFMDFDRPDRYTQ